MNKRNILKPLLLLAIAVLVLSTSASAVSYEVKPSDGEYDVYVDFSSPEDWAHARDDPIWAGDQVMAILKTVAAENGFDATAYYASKPDSTASIDWEIKIRTEVWMHIFAVEDRNIHMSIYWFSRGIATD